MMPNASRQVVLDEVKLERYRALLASTAIFRGCSAAAIDDLARRLQLRTRPAEAIIVAQDEPGDSMFVIAQGRVKVALFGENGRELTLSELKPGDFFGEMSLLDNRPRSANVVAIDDATLLVLTRDAFVAHLKAHPQTAINLLSEMTRRLRRADETIASLALHDVESRLVRTLERLAKEEGEQTDGGLLLRKRPTQQDLANMVGSCRETISRTFTSMIKRGLLVPRGRALVLTRALLERRAAVPASGTIGSMTPDDVLQFWLGAPATDADSFGKKLRRWFFTDKALDAEIRARFGDEVQRARDGALDDWAKTPRGRLALIILLDQFTRNLHRGTPRAYENDARALALAEAGLDQHDDAELSFEEKMFLYMPLAHSEDVSRQERHLALIVAAANAAPPALEQAYAGATAHAKGYLDQIRRFGRFPHRNAVLGRTCTQEEMAFLDSPSTSS